MLSLYYTILSILNKLHYRASLFRSMEDYILDYRFLYVYIALLYSHIY